MCGRRRIRGKLAMDGLYVPTKASWYAAFQQELLTFPSSKHDDMVDALGLIGQLLTMMQPQPKAVPEKKAGGPYGMADCELRLVPRLGAAGPVAVRQRYGRSP